MLPLKELWKSHQLSISVGGTFELNENLPHLHSMGYERVSMVSAPGEFSVRGGIIDIYPLTEEHPIRIELFDTEVDSIRTFSLEDQRSIEMIQEVTIGPAEEIILTDSHYEKE